MRGRVASPLVHDKEQEFPRASLTRLNAHGLDLTATDMPQNDSVQRTGHGCQCRNILEVVNTRINGAQCLAVIIGSLFSAVASLSIMSGSS